MLDRRDFMKFVGGGVVGTLATPVVWKSLDDLSIWSQNWGWIPRLEKNVENSFVRTVSKLSPDACGLSVRCVNGRPVRTFGDSRHMLSRGGLSPLAAAEVQLLYSPARLKRPLLRSSDGGYASISWDKAVSLLVEKIGAIRNARDKEMMCISGDGNGSINEVLSGLCSAVGSPSGFYMMPGDAQTAAAAWRIMGGKGRVGYDFVRSDFVLAVGANVLETFGPVAANRRAWGAAHPSGDAASQRMYYAGPVQNGTAVCADKWIPVKPGMETAFLLGVMNMLFNVGVMPADFAALKPIVADWTPVKAAGIAGVSERQISDSAKALMHAKAPLVIVASPDGQGGPVTPVLLGLLINILLERLNKDGGIRVLPVTAPAINGALTYAEMMAQNLPAVTAKVAAGTKKAPDLLLMCEANPLYALPSEGMRKLLDKAGFKVAISCFFDETTRECDLILPAAMGLERCDDVIMPYGVGEAVCALTTPVQKPLFEARPAGEVLLECAMKAGLFLGFTSYEKVLQAKALRMGVDWDKLRKTGGVMTRGTVGVHELILPIRVLSPAIEAFSKGLAKGLSATVVRKAAFGTPSSGLPPFATKLVGGDVSGDALVARVNGATARKFNLPLSRFTRLKVGDRSVRVKLVADEGVTMDTVALTAGFGHVDFDQFNDGKGDNVFALFTSREEPGTGFIYLASPDAITVKA